MMHPTTISVSPTPPQPAVAIPALVSPAMAEVRARASRLVTRLLAVFSQHDLDAVAATFAPDARIWTGHRGPPVESEQGVRIFVTSLYSRFPGLALELTSCICEIEPADGALDGAAPVTCEARWLARWHDPDSGRLLHQTSRGRYHIIGEQVMELRLHVWSSGPVPSVA